jgi:hypothetical protein
MCVADAETDHITMIWRRHSDAFEVNYIDVGCFVSGPFGHWLVAGQVTALLAVTSTALTLADCELNRSVIS